MLNWKQYWPVIVLFFVLWAGLTVRHYVNLSPVTTKIADATLKVGETYKVKTVKVLEGHRFDIYLANGKRYLVRLNGVIGTPPEVKDRVVRLLNKNQADGHPLTIIPRTWDDSKSHWVVDMHFDSTSVTLSEHLQALGWVYSW